MKIIETKSYTEMSRRAANILSAQVILYPNSVIGLATGSTPLGLYQQLIEWYKKGDLDFSNVRTVNLDEYVGLSADDPHSYRHFMNENLFNHINIRPENTFVPDGTAADLKAQCEFYDKNTQSLGGIDLQLLGIGHNGHIGFNEPDEAFEKMTHVTGLKQSTIDANSRFFDCIDDVPREALTMGLKSIMQAKKILLIAYGKNKAEILESALYGPVTSRVPASILQLHPDLTVVYCTE